MQRPRLTSPIKGAHEPASAHAWIVNPRGACRSNLPDLATHAIVDFLESRRFVFLTPRRERRCRGP